MSQENLEIVRRAIDAYNRGQDALDLFDPEIKWVTTGRFVEPDTYRGHEEVRRYLQALRDDFEELHLEPHELVDSGDHVIAPVRCTGRGRLSTLPSTLNSRSSSRCGAARSSASATTGSTQTPSKP